MMHSPEVGKLVEALAKAQADLSAVPKNSEVKVRTRSGDTYKFKYATLDTIIEHVRKPLADNGLWFAQTTSIRTSADEHYSGKDVVLTTTLFHSSGEWIASEMLVADAGTNQDFGSALTYRKRYALAAILGVASETDDDANVADGNEVQQHTEAQTQAPKTEPRADKLHVRASEFYTNATLFLAKVATEDAFEKWHMDNLKKVADLRDVLPKEHSQLLKLIDDVQKGFETKRRLMQQ